MIIDDALRLMYYRERAWFAEMLTATKRNIEYEARDDVTESYEMLCHLLYSGEARISA